ncbi:MAG: type II toxin-antitoxin system VapC family toxin, partial [Bdellovibrionales bacterium]|nr:type II toxin-antitoxin system VapC family toxin [Bdellovibrionales bacterium]
PMILADTSVWVDHLRRANKAFVELLEDGDVATHPFVVGELACGSLKNRKTILDLLQDLPEVDVASHNEVIELIESRKLMGKGIGWIDAHLLAAALISGTPLWTADKKLRTISAALGVLF